MDGLPGVPRPPLPPGTGFWPLSIGLCLLPVMDGLLPPPGTLLFPILDMCVPPVCAAQTTGKRTPQQWAMLCNDGPRRPSPRRQGDEGRSLAPYHPSMATAASISSPSDPHTMKCLEVWGGNQAVDNGVVMAGLDAWLFSRPFGDPSARGGIHS